MPLDAVHVGQEPLRLVPHAGEERRVAILIELLNAVAVPAVAHRVAHDGIPARGRGEASVLQLWHHRADGVRVCPALRGRQHQILIIPPLDRRELEGQRVHALRRQRHLAEHARLCLPPQFAAQEVVHRRRRPRPLALERNDERAPFRLGETARAEHELDQRLEVRDAAADGGSGDRPPIDGRDRARCLAALPSARAANHLDLIENDAPEEELRER
mmetsp:Transcript_22076/g.65098  ORF Transcript_22076/g.65098 Transcript_22076/m.65098 type:complete len:216 (-) Transcript_22076:631-1278(-)